MSEPGPAMKAYQKYRGDAEGKVGRGKPTLAVLTDAAIAELEAENERLKGIEQTQLRYMSAAVELLAAADHTSAEQADRTIAELAAFHDIK